MKSLDVARRRFLALLGVGGALVTGVGTVGATQPTRLEDPIPEPIEAGPQTVRLEMVASGLTAPNWGTAVPGCDGLANRLVLTDQTGILWSVDTETGEKSVFADLSELLVSLGVGGPGTFDERGLLGVAFHPEYATNGFLYTYTSEPVGGSADFSTMPAGESPNHQSVVREWQVPEPCNPDAVVDPTTAREVLRVDEPQFNHNAGCLNFGPDEKLYISLGDGGAADDQGVGHVPGGNGQDPGNVLGTILRIDPRGTDAANGEYGVPADNPFVDRDGFVDEIYAYGFRNPFRFSFDARTGELYAADVGQNDVEEVDIVVAGGNYGWREKEGPLCFDPNGAEPGFVFECESGDAPADVIDPVAAYDHDEGIAVVGGFVSRGDELPALRGRYIFGDYFHPASGGGRLFYLERNDRIREFRLAGLDALGFAVLGFGQDAGGDLYVLGNQTGVPFGDTGFVMRIASATGARQFRAHLSGDEEVPPVETNAQGQATVAFDDDRTEFDYTLLVANVDDVVAAHIHCAPDGVNGPVGVTLFEGGPVSPDGVLAEATVTEPDADNGCGWESIADVYDAVQRGEAYVNVHTLGTPSGEIRGQLR
ncbi:PQQ-dependent sugar dehydrogenase [Haloferax prahovense]|uniref:PQQ-dependent sugar dehydrogenase n=1 Tax=Haloferax prahovense TaxID=381852 RepID=UPI003C7096D1